MVFHGYRYETRSFSLALKHVLYERARQFDFTFSTHPWNVLFDDVSYDVFMSVS